MAELSVGIAGPTTDERDHMHDLYRQGGLDRLMAPPTVYPESFCEGPLGLPSLFPSP